MRNPYAYTYKQNPKIGIPHSLFYGKIIQNVVDKGLLSISIFQFTCLYTCLYYMSVVYVFEFSERHM